MTPAGKTTKRLSLLSGGEKSLVALGFLFAVFLARPCPFYILDEVEAALDDRNIDRFLELVAPLLRALPVHHHHPPAPHDGGGRRPLRRQHGQRRHLEGGLAAPRIGASDYQTSARVSRLIIVVGRGHGGTRFDGRLLLENGVATGNVNSRATWCRRHTCTRRPTCTRAWSNKG